MTEPVQALPSVAEFLEHSPDMICVLNQDAVVIRVNSAVKRILGRLAKTLIGERLVSFAVPEDREAVEVAAATAVERGTGQTVVCRMLAESGELRAIDWLMSPWGGDMIVAIGRDITERTTIGRRLEAMLRAVPDTLVELDPAGRCVASHDGGRSGAFEFVTGEPLAAGLPEEFAGAVNAALEAALATGEPKECLYQGRGTEALREWECRITPTRDGGTLALFRDVTESREAERALLANLRALDDSAQLISHDLREPLDGMRQLMRWLGELAPEPVCGKADKYLGLMERRLDRMDRLLRGLRRYVRIGAMWPAPEAVDVREVINAATAKVRRRQARLFEVSTHVESGAGELVTVGRALETCLVEIFDNAVLHHDRERCHLDVRVVTRPGARRIEIVDDGPGVGEELLPRIFDLFACFGETDSAGLGLAVVRRILALCQGSVEATSPVYDRRGTSVVLTWPEAWPRAGGVR